MAHPLAFGLRLMNVEFLGGMEMTQPLAIEIYRRFLEGETVEQLSTDLGIPQERIEQRLRVAQAYLQRHTEMAA